MCAWSTCVLMMTHHRAAGSIILMLAYGYEVQDDEDPYVAIVEKAMSEVSRAAKPAAFLVDFFPIRMSHLSPQREWHS